jgi:hypothetical protein
MSNGRPAVRHPTERTFEADERTFEKGTNPMKYAMLICGDESGWYDDTSENQEAAYRAIGEWMEKWQAAGKILDGGAELDRARTAKTVGRGPDGQPVVTDGPYLELKEVIGGFILLAADDIDDAVNVASGWPGIARYGDKVEVRPILESQSGAS